MTTVRELLQEALKETGESPVDLRCFTQTCHRAGCHFGGVCSPLQEVPFAELPNEAFDGGYGGVCGPPFIAFSAEYVYAHAEYDGLESVQAVPRHPESVGEHIPVI